MESIWKIVGASAAGTSHVKKGEPCQDAFEYLEAAGGTLLIAIADGAGSAPLAEEGANLAVGTAIKTLNNLLAAADPKNETEWQNLLGVAFSETLTALTDYAYDEFKPLRNYATTLSVAVVNQRWLSVGQIGDGAIVARSQSGELFTVITPQQGQYANETNFLTSIDALSKIEFFAQPITVTAIGAFTDGLLRLALEFPHHVPHEKFFDPLFNFPLEMQDTNQATQQLIEFLESERVNQRTSDDKTLVLAARRLSQITQENLAEN